MGSSDPSVSEGSQPVINARQTAEQEGSSGWNQGASGWNQGVRSSDGPAAGLAPVRPPLPPSSLPPPPALPALPALPPLPALPAQPPLPPDTPPVPHYLQQTYWWAYLHPRGVRFFERQWLVNLILWGNFARLRDAALAEVGPSITGRTLQVACVYGDFTPRVAARLTETAHLDVVDVAPVQLENLQKKLDNNASKQRDRVSLHLQNSADMAFQDATFDDVIVFFLLHEQPGEVREKTVREAMRVAKPGGKVIFVDYHRPSLFNPLRYLMMPILYTLEPFAMDLWKLDIISWVPTTLFTPDAHGNTYRKETFFGGLYQKVVFKRGEAA